MSDKETADRNKAREQLRQSQARKHITRLQSLLHSQLDSHKWESKMEVFRLLSS